MATSKPKIKVEDKEQILLSIMKLKTFDSIQNNKKAREMQWYGKRLTLLRTMYNKTIYELGIFFNTSTTTIGMWEKGNIKPKQEEIEKLAFLFEVSETFFTQSSVDITIKEQSKIKELW